MELNRKQKIVILVSLVLVSLSILFPPWGDFYPVGDKRVLVVGVVGYSWLFNTPFRYQYSYHNEVQYSDDAIKVHDRREWRESSRKEAIERLAYEAATGKKLIKEFDSRDFDKWSYTLDQEDSIVKVGTKIIQVNDELKGVAAIYHQFLLIQLFSIAIASLGLTLIFKSK